MTVPTVIRLGALLGGSATVFLVGLGVAERHGEQQIQRIATLQVARAAHTATLLRTGKVLIVGGMADGGGSLSSAELFDPTDNSVRPLPPLSARRLGHSATLLQDGRVLIAGGYDGEYLTTMELFDPGAGRFMPAGSLLTARSGHTATLLADGRVLLAGGVGSGWTFLRSAEVYDPRSGRTELVGSMSSPRESHTATLLRDGRVLILGGHAGRRQGMVVYDAAEVYSPDSRRFESMAATMQVPRHKHDAILMRNGRVLVVGGADRTDRNHFSSTEVFNPESGTFSMGPTMRHRRYKIAGTTVLLPNGDVLVTSGARFAEIFHVDGWSWEVVPGEFPAAFRFATATPLPGGGVVIAGGYADDNRNTGAVWRFRSPM